MRLNERTAISTAKVLLVPYEPHHVPLYHEWMQDEALQAATASEPLTLAEEYAMQASWRLDSNKLTFIVCQPLPPPPPSSTASHSSPSSLPSFVIANTLDQYGHMIGDVNLFIYEDDEEDGDAGLVGEVEIMIAKKEVQGKGYGKAALAAFLEYVRMREGEICGQYVPEGSSGDASNGQGGVVSRFKYLRVKINAGNERSIRLFEGFGFKKVKEEPNYFGELELRQLPDCTNEQSQEAEGAQAGGQSITLLEYRNQSA